MKTYRTQEQFGEICESMLNGNWSQAAQECVDFGFYAGDIRKAQESANDDGFAIINDDLDFVELIEMATEIRHKSK